MRLPQALIRIRAVSVTASSTASAPGMRMQAPVSASVEATVPYPGCGAPAGQQVLRGWCQFRTTTLHHPRPQTVIFTVLDGVLKHAQTTAFWAILGM
jgi:hypothetical protein